MNYFIAFVFAVVPSVLGVAGGYWLVLFALATGPMTTGYLELIETPVGPLAVQAIKLLGVLVPTILYLQFRPREFFDAIKQFWFHLPFLFFATATLFWTPDLEFGLRMLAKLWGPFFFLCLVATALKSQKQLKSIVRLMLGFGVIFVIIAITAEITGYNRSIYFGTPGLGPSVFSANMVMIIMLPIATLVLRRSFFDVLLIAFFSAAIYSSFTRITIAGMFAGAAVVFALGTRGSARLAIPLALAVTAFLLFFATENLKERMFLNAADQVSTTDVLSDPSGVLDKIAGSGRYALWDTLIKRLFNPNPVFGAGVGATQEFLYSRSSSGASATHSDYIRILCELGVSGAGLFLFASIGYLLRLMSWLRTLRGTVGESYALAALGAFSAYLLYLSTDNGLDYVNAVGFYVYCLIAMTYKSVQIWTSTNRSGNLAAAAERKPVGIAPGMSAASFERQSVTLPKRY